MAKRLENLDWIEDLLPKTILRKAMFGGFAYYIEQKMVLAIFEDEKTRTYKNKTAPYAIWNGCMFPVEKHFHAEVLKQYPFLSNHPVLPKWLYLPAEIENFESHVEEVILQIKRRNDKFGVIPKAKNKSSGTKNKKSDLNKKEKPEKIDTRRPRMFSDEPAQQVLSAATKISDLKNLGPVSEKVFKKAGIKTAQQFIKMGWKKALVMLVKDNPKNAHSLFTYALIGALKNQEFSHISDADKIEAQSFTKELRDSLKKKKKN
jgi:predicted flap endonuclease-1-like 5' DNA nuclease